MGVSGVRVEREKKDLQALRSLSFLLVDRACRYGCRLNGCERREVVRERLEVL